MKAESQRPGRLFDQNTAIVQLLESFAQNLCRSAAALFPSH